MAPRGPQRRCHSSRLLLLHPSHLRLGQPAGGPSPTVCAGPSCFSTHICSPHGSPGTFDNGSRSCHRLTPSKDRGTAGRPCVTDASQLLLPSSPASDPSRPPQGLCTCCTLSPGSRSLCQASAQMPPLPGSPPATLATLPRFLPSKPALPALAVISVCLPALSSKGQERGGLCVGASRSLLSAWACLGAAPPWLGP